MIELIPVAEMAGWSYSERPLPATGTRDQDPAAWDRYQQHCLADAGVTGLTALVPGSPLYRVRDLDAAALRCLVASELRDLTLPLVEEEVTGIAGGIVLRVRDTIVLEPGCCCGLESIDDWRAATAARDWQEIWVGHDQRRIEAMAEDDRVLLRSAAWASDAWDDVIAIPRGDYERALLEANDELHRLADRITHALPASIEPPWRATLASRLAGVAS